MMLGWFSRSGMLLTIKHFGVHLNNLATLKLLNNLFISDMIKEDV